MWESEVNNYNSSEDDDDLLELGDASSIDDHDIQLSNETTTVDGVLLNRYGVPISQGLLGKPRAQRRASVGGKWSAEEDTMLKEIVEVHGAKSWKKVANLLGKTRTDVQCLHRWNKVLRPGLQKGAWTKEEDQVVKSMVMDIGVAKIKWSYVAEHLPGRIGKQCRERWFNHLDPSIKKGDWSRDEEVIIYEAQRHFGNRWCEISKLLPGRTENAVKNRWNSCTMKKWLKEKQLEEAAENSAGDSSSFLPLAVSSLSSVSTGKKRGRSAAGNGDTEKSDLEERERMLASLESFRRSLHKASVSLCPEAAAALEGIMTGETKTLGSGAPGGTANDPGFLWSGTEGERSSQSTGGNVVEVEAQSRIVNWQDARAARGIYESITASAGPPGFLYPIRGASSAAAGVSDAHDECAHQLVEMLHLLKKTPASPSVGMSGRNRNIAGGIASASGSQCESDRSSGLGENDSGGEYDAEFGDGDVTNKRQARENSGVEQKNPLTTHLEKVQALRKKKKTADDVRELPLDVAGKSVDLEIGDAAKSTMNPPTFFPNNFRQFGLMEPQQMRLQQLDEVPPSALLRFAKSKQTSVAGDAAVSRTENLAGVLSRPTSKFDPTCPVSVAMAKLSALIGDSPEVNPPDPPGHAAPASSSVATSSSVNALGTRSSSSKKTGNQSSVPSTAAPTSRVPASGPDGEEDEDEDEEAEDVPLECLRFFKLLNRGARKSLMKQLISQLQRTACTPRDVLGFGETPRSFLDHATAATSLGLMREILPGYDSHNTDNELLDPNCFEMADQDDNHSMPPPSLLANSLRHNYSTSKTGSSGINFPEHLTLMPPPSVLPLSRRSPMSGRYSGRAGGLSGVQQQGGNLRLVRPHRLSAEDEAAVEAAVEIGYLLSQYNQPEADLLLQTLHREGNLNIFGSSSTPKIEGKLGSFGR